MSNQDLEKRYEGVKKAIFTSTPTMAVALIGYSALIENPTFGTNSLIFLFSIWASTLLIWIAEIIDC